MECSARRVWRAGHRQQKTRLPAGFLLLAQRLHALDHGIAKGRAADFGSAVHQTGKVIRHHLVADGFFHRADDQVGGFGPAHVAQHHFGRQDQSTLS